MTLEADVVRNVEDLALARALEDCLEAMDRGETDLDRLAERYTTGGDDIKPLLEIANHLMKRRGWGAPLSLDFREELRDRLLSRGVPG